MVRCSIANELFAELYLPMHLGQQLAAPIFSKDLHIIGPSEALVLAGEVSLVINMLLIGALLARQITPILTATPAPGRQSGTSTRRLGKRALHGIRSDGRRPPAEQRATSWPARLSTVDLIGHAPRPALQLRHQSPASTDLLDVVVNVHRSFRRAAAPLAEHGSRSLSAEVPACQ